MQRKYDLDWLRTIIVLTIIPFHAFVIFDQNPKAIMYVKDNVNVLAFNNISGVIDRFHMVALFLVSGIAIYYSLKNRSINAFISDRLIKLGLPLLAGSILLNPVMTYFWSITQGKNDGFIAHYIGFFTKNIGEFDGLNGGYTPAHLWFILYLFIFSLIGLPLFLWLKSNKSEKISDLLAAFFYKPLSLAILAIPYCCIYLIEILDEKNPIAYLYIVIVGCIFATDERYFKALNRDKWVYLIMSISMYILFFYYKDIEISGEFQVYAYDFLVKLLKIIPAYALLGLFNCYIAKKSEVLKYLSQACYPIYIIHMLVLTATGFVVTKYNITPTAKLLIIVTITYILCFLIYEILKRTRYLKLLVGIPSSNNRKTNIEKSNKAMQNKL